MDIFNDLDSALLDNGREKVGYSLQLQPVSQAMVADNLWQCLA
jgi:hypothetical protein